MSQAIAKIEKWTENRKPPNSKILLIEDNKDFSSLAQLVLEKAGYQTYVAESGREGIQLCVKIEPNIVFLDMRLPDMTSSDVARKINSLCQSNPTIIGLTGHSPIDIAAELESSSIQFCIQKPMGLTKLSNALINAIGETVFDGGGKANDKTVRD